MARSQNVITIPTPPADAYNQQRPVSSLLWEQVEHLAAVVRRQIDEERRAVRTEGQAGDFIRKMTAILHPQGSKKRRAPSSRSAGKKSAPASKGAGKKSARSSKG